jgi:hypothetical protein
MSSWIKNKGTQTGEFQLGFDGPVLKKDNGNLQLRNTDNSAFVDIATGNITSAGTITGNGSGLSAIAAGNIVGTVANATYAINAGVAGIANVAYSVAGANVSGTVGAASVAYSIDGANVSGAVALATSATTAVTANSVAGANVVGAVGLATFATTANAVAGANVSGYVANATHATVADSANSVAGGNVVGQVGNALVAGTVYTAAQPAITSLGTLSALNLGGDVTGSITPSANVTYDLGSPTKRFKDLYLSTSTIYVGDANISASGTNIALSGGNITGDLNVGGNATITGNLAVTGNLTYINVVDLRVQDPIIELGGGPNGTPLTTNDGMDRGEILHYYAGSAKNAFIGWKNSASEFQVGADVSITNNVVTINSLGNLRADTFIGALSGTATFATTANAVAGANVSGTVANATYAISAGSATVADSANAVAGANVSGTVALATSATTAGSATTAATVTTAAQPNITSVGTLTSVTVSGVSTLGSIGNVKITGGTTGYVLTTDGTGNLSWSATQSAIDSWKAKSVALVFGSTSTVTVMTLPANAVVDKVSLVVDTAFNGTSPSVSIGLAGGSGFEYAAATDINLKSLDRYDMPSQIAPSASSGVIQLLYSASGSSAGAARVIVTYAIPA